MKIAPLDPVLTRSVLAQLPDVAAQESLEPPPLDRIYVPMGHQKALSLDVSVVVGMRGAGKSLWTAVLSTPAHRAAIADLIQSPALRDVEVRVGFGLDESNEHFPSEATLGKLVADGHAPLSIWQAVVLRHAFQALGKPLPFPEDWRAAVMWMAEYPEQVGAHFRACDEELRTAGKTLLVVFDALDRLAGSWDGVRTLMEAALQLGLQCRSWRSIRLKFFLRPDMEEDEAIWRFRDSSKLRHAKVELNWRTADLYSLVLMYLANHGELGPRFREFVDRKTKVAWVKRAEVFSPARALVADERLRPVVEAIAGEWMGTNAKRGFTYSWIPTHLADAAGRISPRSFLLAFRRAAEFMDDRYPDHDRALYYEAIQQGVAAASEIRVSEIKEDYPWVEPLLEAARGLTVPCGPGELTGRWTPDRIQEVQQANDKLPPRRFSTDPYRKGMGEALIDDLVELAVLYRTADARLNRPDIFRVGFGIKRMGGVKPPR
jgi:hypothetical protein